MGTNFYFLTKDKEKRDKWFTSKEWELTDEPDWGYLIHIAKTSGGWLPLFEDHERVHSVASMKLVYDDGFKIIDEYNQYYDWDQFTDRVLRFSEDDERAHSHILNGPYRQLYFTDGEGYEFVFGEFC